MRKQILIAASILACFSQLAFAQSGLQGTWKLMKQECSSGAPYVLFGANSNMQGSLEGTVTFAGHELHTNFNMQMKYDSSYADGLIKQIQDGIDSANKQPDGPEKQKALADLYKSLKFFQQYKKGVSCTVNEVDAYSVTGSDLHTGPVLSRFSNCPGEQSNDDGTNYDSRFEVKGEVLKVIDGQPENQVDGSCPKGDRTVSVLVRVN